jgi:ABC-2 type transport system permease protein
MPANTATPAPPPHLGPASAWAAPPARRTGPLLFHPTVARLTYRALLGRRRALLLFALPLLLLIIVAAVRVLAGADDSTTADVLQGFALSAMVPLVGVIAGTGAIGPEIDDGAIVYLLAKPIRRGTIISTKLLVAIGVTMAFSAIPTLLAGYILNANGQNIAVAFAVGAAVASIAYAAVFLLLGVLTRHAVVVGLVYALVWEGVIGNVVPGARTLSVQQWALAVAQKLAHGDVVSSDVGLTASVVLLVAATGAATWFAARKLRSLKIAGEE